MRDRLRLLTQGTALALLVTPSFLALSCSRPDKAADAVAPAASASSAPKSGELKLDSAQRQKIRLETVTSTPFHRNIETTGTVAFDQNRATQVLSPVSGPVARLLVEVGARVGKDQALAVVSSPDFAVDVSALRKAEADRDAALQQLRDLGVDAKTINEIKDNRPAENAGALIRSPLAGTVVEKLVTPGQLLAAGTTPCFTVADLSTVWVMANVFETDLPFISPGDSAEILTEGQSAPIPGKVDYIAALVDPTTRAIAVRIVAANPNGILKRDLYVRAAIQSRRESTGLLVPVSAVLRDDENLPFVFVANANGSTFGRRRVQLGSRVGDRQEITSGLTAGETIVVEGGLFLQTAENS